MFFCYSVHFNPFFSPTFGGSYSGIDNMQSHLLLEKGIKVSKKKIAAALREIDEYSATLVRRHKFSRRHYVTFGARML